MEGNSILQRFYDEVDANYTIDHTASTCMEYLYVPFLASFFYVVLVFSGKRFMESRKKLDLQLPLTLWNTLLASYSILGFVILAPPLYRDLVSKGFTFSMCNSRCNSTPWLSFWAYSFTLSKLVELGDTFFVVVRKSPLTFLHWYHHCTVLCYTWYGLASRNEAGHWFGTMNLGVHSVMYTYYTLKSLKFHIPSQVAKVITVLQLLQFAVGIVIVVNAAYLYVNGLPCGVQQAHLIAGFIMYGSYFLLFLNFFYHRYIKAKAPKKKEE